MYRIIPPYDEGLYFWGLVPNNNNIDDLTGGADFFFQLNLLPPYSLCSQEDYPTTFGNHIYIEALQGLTIFENLSFSIFLFSLFSSNSFIERLFLEFNLHYSFRLKFVFFCNNVRTSRGKYLT